MDTNLTNTTIATRELTPEQKFLEDARVKALQFVSTIERGRKRGGFSLPRAHFDPTIKAHLQSYHSFLTTGNWGDVLFETEFPYDGVVETVTNKFALHVLEHMLARSN